MMFDQPLVTIYFHCLDVDILIDLFCFPLEENMVYKLERHYNK